MIFPRRIYDLGLSHKAVSVYCYLANRADENGECFPAVRRIAEDLSIDKSTVYRAFKELEKHDLLERNPALSCAWRTAQFALQNQGRDWSEKRCLIG